MVLTQPGGRGGPILTEVEGELESPPIWKPIEAAVRRMLSFDLDLAPFHDRCRRAGAPFASAPGLGFGRLLRAPTLFEDVVKIMATTNTSWSGTRSMVAKLVAVAGHEGEFPSAGRLARIGAERAARSAGWGYRSPYLAALAEGVAGGALDLGRWETWKGPTAELEREIRAVPGLGPYAAAAILALLGRFDRIGIDSVFRSFVRRRYFPRARRPPHDRRLLAVYKGWGEWQALAYWFEVWHGHWAGGEALSPP